MRIKSIKEVTPRTVYAVGTSTGTYIADGLAHHNCKRCNKWLNGNYTVYKYKLDDKYGYGTAGKLEQLAHDNPTYSFKKEELLQVIHDSKEALAAIERLAYGPQESS